MIWEKKSVTIVNIKESTGNTKQNTKSKTLHLISGFYYPPRSEGDNRIGSVRQSVRQLSRLGFAEGSKGQRRVIISPRRLSVCRIITRMRSIGFYFLWDRSQFMTREESFSRGGGVIHFLGIVFVW